MNQIFLAAADIDQAFRQLEFAIKLLNYIELNNVDRSSFDSEATVLFQTENLVLPANTFESDDALCLAAQINVGISFGATAIVLDAAFDAAGIAKNPASNAADDILRTLVYMVRSAFAHNPANPRWEVRGPHLREVTVDLEGVRICIPLDQLHGREFEYEHIGGVVNWYRIKRAVEQRIKLS